MTALGPRTLKAIEEIREFDEHKCGYSVDSCKALIRRVALIAVEEERERCAQVAVEAQRFCTDYCDSAAAAIRDGR